MASDFVRAQAAHIHGRKVDMKGSIVKLAYLSLLSIEHSCLTLIHRSYIQPRTTLIYSIQPEDAAMTSQKRQRRSNLKQVPTSAFHSSIRLDGQLPLCTVGTSIR